MVLFLLAPSEELNLAVFYFPTHNAAVVFFAQADKTLISWALCNHWTPPTGQPQSKSTTQQGQGSGYDEDKLLK